MDGKIERYPERERERKKEKREKEAKGCILHFYAAYVCYAKSRNNLQTENYPAGTKGSGKKNHMEQ